MNRTKYDRPAVSPLRRPLAPQLSALLVPVVLAAQERRLFTESRKIYAVVAGLVVVALCLSLLTVGYWRRTKPVRPVRRRGVVAPATQSARVGRQSVAGADHAAADDTWESHATGEHERIDPPRQSVVRPSAAARKQAMDRAREST